MTPGPVAGPGSEAHHKACVYIISAVINNGRAGRALGWYNARCGRVPSLSGCGTAAKLDGRCSKKCRVPAMPKSAVQTGKQRIQPADKTSKPPGRRLFGQSSGGSYLSEVGVLAGECHDS
jgi:hypothetical protein